MSEEWEPGDDIFIPRVSIPTGFCYSWASQACQYVNRGEPGIRYERHYAGHEDREGCGPPVDCLLYFNASGYLVGILNHYPEGEEGELEQAGNVNVWVHPKRQRQGIGTALVREAAKRWPIEKRQQRYTAAGVALLRALEREQP